MSGANAKSTVDPFVISREFDAPRGLVFKAFTEVERLKHWWGPKGFKVIASQMDLRPDGTYHYGLQAPDGSSMWGRFVYREIGAPERIVFINSFSDEKGGLTRHPLQKEWPLEMLSTFSFEDLGSGRTKVTIVWVPIDESDAERHAFDTNRESMTQGWTGTLDRLEDYLADITAQTAKA